MAEVVVVSTIARMARVEAVAEMKLIMEKGSCRSNDLAWMSLV